MDNELDKTHSFGWALERLHEGKFVAREGWNGKGMYLGLQMPDEYSANRQPYIWIMPVGGKRVPWVASHPDMLGEDWGVVEVGGGLVA